MKYRQNIQEKRICSMKKRLRINSWSREMIERVLPEEKVGFQYD